MAPTLVSFSIVSTLVRHGNHIQSIPEHRCSRLLQECEGDAQGILFSYTSQKTLTKLAPLQIADPSVEFMRPYTVWRKLPNV